MKSRCIVGSMPRPGETAPLSLRRLAGLPLAATALPKLFVTSPTLNANRVLLPTQSREWSSRMLRISTSARRPVPSG
jgi:hypothetical protein